MSGDRGDRVSQKAELRALAKAGRAQARAASPNASENAAKRFLDAIPLDAGLVVSGYRPIRDEIDPTPLMTALIEQGARLCTPVVEGDAAPLSFRAWSPDAEMTRGAFGAEIPKRGETLTPELLILPLLAFDRTGARLGYGGGHYDRTLEALRAAGEARGVGLAYAAQEMAALPQEPTDQRLDAVVTERGALFFPR